MRKIFKITKSSDGFISRHINRKISIRISKFLLKIHPEINPITVSYFCFILALLGGFFFLFTLPLIGGIVVQISSIIDGCDGEIARLTNKASKKGAFMDSVLDRYADLTIITLIMYYLQGTFVVSNFYTIIFLVGVLAIVGSLLISYTATKSVQFLSYEFPRTIEGRDFRCFVIMIGGITSLFWAFSLFVALLYIACITNFKTIQRVYQMKKLIQ
ncbi:MAG: CDP-alcohol phosphatidyltransferase family protein [Candidatus Helarchaeota archaeon]|nr:CDP-alcohol phosphatidyltransferase family protein [Candidatus Helarchaeota archaeon]